MKPNYSLDDLRCFCAVARSGSFKLAARSLGMPLSTLSRRIRQLEADLQLRLLNRDAHRVVLTNIGEQYFQRSVDLFDELNDIDEDLHRDKYQPKGKICISAPINAGSQFLRTIFYDFLLQYPEIQLDISFSNSLIDIEAEGIDVVFRVGNPVVDNWIARPLKHVHFILCSHPDYDISGITTPDELCGHPTIICRPMIPWQLVHKESGQEFDYHPNKGVRLEVDEILMLTHAIKKGLGIGYVPDYFALPMIAQGEMNHVLPNWSSKVRTLFMLYRDRDYLPMRVRLFIEFVMMHFNEN
ncbi:LysR family transcriptional regulator [Vibrio rotiferianus]|uniref:LysR family transcriptional regulator n=2 Tax=Vibrionaceae TaxID=641 RepID=A0A510I7U4_9VIBR|nr:LysR family transcriptional regulator [Vibrio rotiferianus]ASI98006.1 LysR family transcriptional regulator [Vibrio rotiferianus]TMX63450.1 LysR family transcriptional regulator [Vibrio rotiferianus]BBL89551.1 LysR family transcriptional regulator [Vibrio rotiferianus]